MLPPFTLHLYVARGEHALSRCKQVACPFSQQPDGPLSHLHTLMCSSNLSEGVSGLLLEPFTAKESIQLLTSNP